MHKFILMVIVVAMFTFNIPSARSEGLAEMYPGPWQDDFNMSITKALSKNRITGCGEYKYRAHKSSSNEYLVYCTRDGNHWTAYLVWDLIGKVMGPYKTDPSIE